MEIISNLEILVFQITQNNFVFKTETLNF